MEMSSTKSQQLYCCRDCVTHGLIHRQARVTFHNFAEVNFRDFLLAGTGVEIGTNGKSHYADCITGTFDSLIGTKPGTPCALVAEPSLGTSDLNYADS